MLKLPCYVATEYLAVSTVSQAHSLLYRTLAAAASPNLLQIWSLDTSKLSDLNRTSQPQTGGRGMRLELALLTDNEISQLQWCPKGGDSAGHPTQASDGQAAKGTRLGFLAALMTNGQLVVHDVPTPEAARQRPSVPSDDLVFSMCMLRAMRNMTDQTLTLVRARQPLFRLDLGTMPISCFEWSSHERIIVGTTTGPLTVLLLVAFVEQANLSTACRSRCCL